ncbi:putative alpha/beta-glucosidase agdC [Psilocybe cubensis]|uniref:Alpha/beta-glucosidase agdC n=1 Tax=Psilocybe cubensis TaxID=181762 RepID=A0ACB8GPG9_PSICU|nr:putative alpha/beta-glucosidase agdC [Psilocybe cubensis]KAH9477307.1 putative alpha/beta-glucosidase agdC [Psilocybe cubensis]
MSNQHRNSKLRALVALSLLPVSTLAAVVDPSILQACPGYTATNVRTKRDGLTADLTLRGSGCNVFGPDINKLSLNVVYETSDRIHVKIVDASAARYEVPASVFPRPDARRSVPPQAANIRFNYTTSPFSFSVYRANTREVLFSTAGNPLIFEPQYLRVKTNLPQNPNIYGLGEHTNPFHLPTDNLTLTLWSRDAYGISPRSNLYGNHPVYFEHRTTGTHGVFLLNSNGMDIKLNSNSLEYNIIGGVLDFYFLAGSERDPTELARQYSEVVGLPAEVPYWSFGFHQCRFGYRDFVDVANVIVRYAASKIPLETMWTDIDYMDRRRTFTLDPDYFPLKKVREIVDYLHGKGQKYIMMTDPAIGYFPGEGYAAYEEGKELDIYLKNSTGDPYIGLVWADWFHKNIRKYWTNQFKRFYNPQTGVDIDGVWIDMNEPASFCIAPCADPYAQSIEQKLPPPRPRLPPNADTPLFTNTSAEVAQLSKRDDIINPPYAIDNAIGSLSNKTADTSIKQYNGLTQYDTHNLYGSMMSTETRHAMLARRPSKKPLIITRSTFAGAGAHVGKWLGDNLSLWDHYRFSIAGMLGFASIYQVPMVGSDICGFGGNTTETLCARWASLGAFQPFMRNHNGEDSISQEFYIWPTVAEAARSAIDVRYRLMDYLYTAFHQAHLDGTPVLHPLWFKYPKDSNTFPIDLQFFYGDSILVSPVTEDDATSVSIYLPKDTFYDFNTLAPVQGTGSFVKFENVSFTEIPLHIKSGVVLPLRSKSAMTTIELRKTDFELVVAPNARGEASGSLYIDDGESLVVTSSTNVKFAFSNGKLDVSGRFGYRTGVNVARVRFLGVNANPSRVTVDGRSVKRSDVSYDAANKVLDVTVGVAFNKGFSVQYSR